MKSKLPYLFLLAVLITCGAVFAGSFLITPKNVKVNPPVLVNQRIAVAPKLNTPVLPQSLLPIEIFAPQPECSPSNLINRSTEDCIKRNLTFKEAANQLVKDQKALGFVPTRTNNPLFKNTVFKVASYNVLGSSHTCGKKRDKKGWQCGTTRMARSIDLIKRSNLSIVGFQEFQSDQVNLFSRSMPNWETFPGNDNRDIPEVDSISWNKEIWDLVETHSIQISYFYGGHTNIPYVLLKNKETGRKVWILNSHNPVDKGGSSLKWRIADSILQGKLANKLLTTTPYPVIVTGDMNDREKFFCNFAAQENQMHASNGSFWDNGCKMASKTNIDWVTGSKLINFSDHIVDYWTQDTKTSDHPMIRTVATILHPLDKKDCAIKDLRGHKYLFCKKAALNKAQQN